MLLDYFMNPELYTAADFWQTLFFTAAGFLFAAYLFAAVQASAALLLREKEADLSFHPIRLFTLRKGILAALYLLFGTAFISAGKPTGSRFKTFLTAVSVPLFGLLAGWGCVMLYAATTVIILRSFLLALATAFVSGGIFSLCPLPGLPGGNFVACLLPEKLKNKWETFKEYLPLTATIAAGLLARSGIADTVIAAVIARF